MNPWDNAKIGSVLTYDSTLNPTGDQQGKVIRTVKVLNINGNNRFVAETLGYSGNGTVQVGDVDYEFYPTDQGWKLDEAYEVKKIMERYQM